MRILDLPVTGEEFLKPLKKIFRWFIPVVRTYRY